jgi:hypothetical protein
LTPKKPKQPWQTRATDFSQGGLHAKFKDATAYMLFFEFLRLSPSYQLARLEAAGKLTADQMYKLPADFDDVRRTFSLLGDVQRVVFRKWWLERGLRAFALPGIKPRIHTLVELKAGEYVQDAEPVQKYLTQTRADEGLPHGLLLAIPLDRSKSQLLRQISKLLEDALPTQPLVPATPALTLQGKRFREKELRKGLRLLTMQAAFPRWSQWRVATLVGINPDVAKVLDPRTTEKPDAAEIVDRSLMMRSASRDFKKYRTLAENAARGRFPSFAAVLETPFDWNALHKQIAARNAWQKMELARIEGEGAF